MKILINLLLIITLSNTCFGGDSTDIAPISLHEATQKILREGNKRVLGASTEIIDGRAVHVIKVLTPNGRILYFKIDAETGALIN